jgi:serine protease inhibitor
MLLLNAIYFKGRWLNPFPPKDTFAGSFYANDQNTITADFMKIVTTLKHVHSDDLGAYVVRLPYEVSIIKMN